MAIDLLNGFLNRGKSVSSNQSNTKTQVQNLQNVPHNMQVMRAIRSLQAGQTIQGEVVSVNGDEVQLAIMKDVIIDARLAQSMNLTQGMNMSFQIKANNSQGLSLVPLFMNTSVDPNVLKALEMAGVSVNDRSLEMVQTLMEKGMPIDKQSIQEIYRDIVSFKDATVNDIISLHQIKLPVTEDNLNQFSLYQNNRHYLADSFSEMGESIGKHLENLVLQQKPQEAAKLLQQLQDFMNAIKGENAGKENVNSEIIPKMLRENEISSSQSLKADVSTPEILTNEDGKELPEGALLSKNKEGAVLEENALSEKTLQNTDKNMASETISKEAQLWNQLNELIHSGKNTGKISKIFEKIWGSNIEKQWLLEPEAVTDKEKIVSYFEKLGKQVKQLESIFEQGNMSKSDVAKVLHNTSSNLEFMNQLNQMHAYIQLPLKMANQNAHGELYVFTNKKALTRQDGKVSALLHLDMEHIGNMDIYVALEDTKVSTNFYLEKEEYLDFIEKHMDMLTARLNKRGYQCDIKTALRNPEDSMAVIKNIEKEDGRPVLLSTQAFDMRA